MGRRLICILLSICLLLVTSLACRILASPSISTTKVQLIAPLPSATGTETGSIQGMPRWVNYERALADILLGPVGKTVPDLAQDHGLCEWEVWGQDGHDIYVWAECQVNDLTIGTATGTPAIVRLADDGNIAEVIMPDEGWVNILDLFPQDILQHIFENNFDAVAAMEHIALRHADPSIPPQVVLDGIELP